VSQPDLEELAHVPVVQGVVDDLSLSPSPDQAQVSKTTKLMGNGGFGEVQGRCEIAHAHLLVPESHHDAQAARIAETFEDRAQPVDLPPRDGAISSPRDAVKVDDPDITPFEGLAIGFFCR
jgi:hypothetical protein